MSSSYLRKIKPLSGEAYIAENSITAIRSVIFQTSELSNFFSNGVLDNVFITNSRIENTIIGLERPSTGYFSQINVYDEVFFGEEGDPYTVHWNATSGNFDITGSLNIDNITINNNTINSSNELNLRSADNYDIFLDSGNNISIDANQTFVNSNLSLNKSLNYSFERYSMDSTTASYSPSPNVIMSLFSVIEPSIDCNGTMPSLGISDGTFKILVCSSMAENSTYTIHFPIVNDKPTLITPNPCDTNAIPTKLIFKRRSQSAQIVYDYDQSAWVLITAGAYVK